VSYTELGNRSDFARRGELQELSNVELRGWRGNQERPIGWPRHLDSAQFDLVLGVRKPRTTEDWLFLCPDYSALMAAWTRTRSTPFQFCQLTWLKLPKQPATP
jgi:hypothetical protein